MSKKNKLSATTNPMHFEDLEPHRFEDLVRQLIYDLRDWATIEATGKGGSDDGYDARAFEKAPKLDEADISPVEGNLWMIQCKREKTLGPKRVADIVNESIGEEVPYGFILAAPTNFSKKSYDTFREKMREKGVMDFYLWGKPELEDMLYLPKNDRILFTFFGVSFISRRKSRSTEVRAVITAKNKLQKLFTSVRGVGIGQNILVRDIKDIHYPFKDEYPDFDKDPKWKEYFVTGHHPLGIWVTIKKLYAYVDEKKKIEDHYPYDTLPRKERMNKPQEEEEMNIRDHHQMLPLENQAMLVVEGLILYEDILVVDDQGDVSYDCPHIYVDFQGKSGPFSNYFEYFENEKRPFKIKPRECKKTEIFPDKVGKINWGKIHKKPLTVSSLVMHDLQQRLDMFPNIYLPADAKIKPYDVVELIEEENNKQEYFQVKTIQQIKVGDILKPVNDFDKNRVQKHLECLCGELSTDDVVSVLELRRVYQHWFTK